LSAQKFDDLGVFQEKHLGVFQEKREMHKFY